MTATAQAETPYVPESYYSFPYDELDEAIAESGIEVSDALAKDGMRTAAAKVLVAFATAISEADYAVYLNTLKKISLPDGVAERDFCHRFYNHLRASESRDLREIIEADSDLSARMVGLELLFA